MNEEKRRDYLTGLSYLEEVNQKDLAVQDPNFVILVILKFLTKWIQVTLPEMSKLLARSAYRVG